MNKQVQKEILALFRSQFSKIFFTFFINIYPNHFFTSHILNHYIIFFLIKALITSQSKQELRILILLELVLGLCSGANLTKLEISA